MRLPAELLPVHLQAFDVQRVAAGIQHLVIAGTPRHSIHRVSCGPCEVRHSESQVKWTLHCLRVVARVERSMPVRDHTFTMPSSAPVTIAEPSWEDRKVVAAPAVETTNFFSSRPMRLMILTEPTMSKTGRLASNLSIQPGYPHTIGTRHCEQITGSCSHRWEPH